MALCDPSQNGLLLDAPHRQREKGTLGGWITLPSWSLMMTSPLTSVDPFFRMMSSTAMASTPITWPDNSVQQHKNPNPFVRVWRSRGYSNSATARVQPAEPL